MTMMLRMLMLLCFSLSAALSTRAADLRVRSRSELAVAIDGANADREAAVIWLTADITLDEALPLIFSDITIEGNGFTISAGGQYRIFFVESGASLRVKDLALRDGAAHTELSYWPESIYIGGAIYNKGDLSVSNSRFTDNSADWGGAIFNRGQASVTGSGFTGNAAEQGGAIFNDDEASFSISESSFSGNMSESAGGAIYNVSEASVSDSSFSGNAAVQGGAIYNTGDARISSGINISNSVFTGNSAEWGGALLTVSEASISDSSLIGNSADHYGGGVYIWAYEVYAIDFAGELHLRNSIIANNPGGDCDLDGDGNMVGEIVENVENYIWDGSCNPRWSGSDASPPDYCPASQSQDGVCQIGAFIAQAR
ncbi:MAG: hypothetical protein OXI77_02065 [Chloroflexota bacterium]|nr:hypothetical protein [Chloroflexota bacterium]MDE2908520.1 hypothetical protein [Chloroflexota bacterium]